MKGMEGDGKGLVGTKALEKNFPGRLACVPVGELAKALPTYVGLPVGTGSSPSCEVRVCPNRSGISTSVLKLIMCVFS